MTPQDELDLGSKWAEWKTNVRQFAWEMFGFKPDWWQGEVFDAFPHTNRIAMKACAGPGKTAALAILAWNFLVTRPHPMIGVTSITGDNLKSGMWAELARWRNRDKFGGILPKMFEMTKKEIFFRPHQQTWKLEGRSWARDADADAIGNALAGLHAEYVMWLPDEVGDYPPAVLPNMEGIFAGSPKEAHIVAAGNPSSLSGMLYHICTVASRLWKVVEITADPDDPNRTPRVSVESARQMIEQWGRDNPWVLYKIFGKFPPADFKALIGPDEVREAMKRYYRKDQIGDAPRVVGVDVAGQGDDSNVIARRHGIQMFPFLKYRNLTPTQGAGLVATVWREFQPDAVFTDDTGGFASGWNDNLRNLGFSPTGVHFGSAAHSPMRFKNKRTEMYWDFVEWIRRGGALPPEDSLGAKELLAALTQTTFNYVRDAMILEPKDDVKVKIGYSPDEADASVLLHAEPVGIKTKLTSYQQKHAKDFNPYREEAVDRSQRVRYPAHTSYDPYE